MALFNFGSQDKKEKKVPNAPIPAKEGAPAVYDVTDQNFATEVLEASNSAVIIVDFWAPWCAPCKQLQPLLEAAVEKTRGKVRLAKLNIEQHQAVAAQLRVQSIPAAFAFFAGRPVDGFVGAISAKQIDQFIQRVISQVGSALEDPIETLISKAHQQLADNDLGEATNSYAAVLQIEPENPEALAGIATCWLRSGDVPKAEALLDSLPDSIKDNSAFASVRAEIALVNQSSEHGEIEQLQMQVANNPEDLSGQFELAKALAASGNREKAVEILLGIIKADRNWSDGEAKEFMITIFQAWGDEDPRTQQNRRKLAMLWF